MEAIGLLARRVLEQMVREGKVHRSAFVLYVFAFDLSHFISSFLSGNPDVRGGVFFKGLRV